ncbi:MAG: hypothetical protein FWC97_11905 [Treponema sp.]|nr:hypothetical protein [Treponema sp.]
MKNTIKLFGIIVLIAIIGFSMIACEDDSLRDTLDGTTWKANFGGSDFVLTFNSPNFTMTWTEDGGTETESGTYSISGNNVSLISGGEVFIGILSGNNLDFSGEAGHFGPIFTKQ